MPFFKLSVASLPGPASLSPRQALDYVEQGATILDIRPDFETNYRVFGVPKVYFLAYREYREQSGTLPRDEPLIVADNVGTKSPEVARFLLEQGFPEVAWLAGGMVAWAQEGLPLERDAGYELSGGCACKLRPKKPRPEGSAVAPKSGEQNEPT